MDLIENCIMGTTSAFPNEQVLWRDHRTSAVFAIVRIVYPRLSHPIHDFSETQIWQQVYIYLQVRTGPLECCFLLNSLFQVICFVRPFNSVLILIVVSCFSLNSWVQAKKLSHQCYEYIPDIFGYILIFLFKFILQNIMITLYSAFASKDIVEIRRKDVTSSQCCNMLDLYNSTRCLLVFLNVCSLRIQLPCLLLRFNINFMFTSHSRFIIHIWCILLYIISCWYLKVSKLLRV